MKGKVGTGGTTLTCSITSGAIQHGVPTNVFLTLFLVMSPPVAKKALTPKSSGGKADDKTINRLTHAVYYILFEPSTTYNQIKTFLVQNMSI